MNEELIYTSMINAATSAIPVGFLALNADGAITHLYSAKPFKPVSMRCIGRNFKRCLNLVFGLETAETIYMAYRECFSSRAPVDLVRIKHITSRGLFEYLDWKFMPVDNANSIIVFVHNITESVLIEEEFTAMSEQYESVNREYCVAMSNLDFHLMDIEQAHKKVAALYRITSIVQRTVNEQEVLEEILDGIIRELGFSNVSIMLLDEVSQELEITAFRGQLNTDVRIPLGKGITGFAAQNRELIYVEDVFSDPRFIDGGNKCTSEVAVPLIVDDRAVGVLNIDINDGRTLQPYDLDLLRSLASQVAMTIDHASHVAKVEMQAITDGLTGLYNYRYFRTLLDQEFKRAMRYKRPLAMIMIDIDYFKHYNDNNGHRQGDEALFTVAHLIKQCCRDVDFAIRYGGEEFAVLLPETDIREACIMAERLKSLIANNHFPNGESQPNGKLTISVGVAGFPHDASNILELIDHADTAMYQAKQCRNTICLFDKNSFKQK